MKVSWSRSATFYLFALVIAALAVSDGLRLTPSSTATSTQPPPPGIPKCFAGDAVVVGFEPFEPLMRDTPPQPSGFTKDVVDHVLRSINCENIVWRQFRDDTAVDLVAAPPSTIEALVKSGKWEKAGDYAVASLGIVARQGTAIDPQTALVAIDQRWFALLRAEYPKGESVPDAIDAYIDKRPVAAITPDKSNPRIDHAKYEVSPLTIRLSLVVATRRQKQVEALKKAITAAKPFIDTAIRNSQLAGTRSGE